MFDFESKDKEPGQKLLQGDNEVALGKEDNQVGKLSDGENGSLAKKITGRWNSATTGLSGLREDSRIAWDYYLENAPELENVIKQNNDAIQVRAKQRKGLRMGHIPRAVDSVHAAMHNATFPQDDRFFRGTPKNETAKQYQDIYEAYRAENFGETDFTQEIWKHRLNVLLDGTAVLAAPFKRTVKKKTTYEPRQISAMGVTIPLDFLGLREVVDPKYVCWEGTKIEALDFNDWRADPWSSCWEDAWFIRKMYLPIWKVKERFGIDDVQTYQGSTDPNLMQKRADAGYDGQEATVGATEEEAKRNALLHFCYDDFVIKGKTYKNHLAIMLNDRKIIWFGENSYNHGLKPYVFTPCIPLPRMLYGMSLVKHATPSARVIDKATDQILRVAAWAANPVFTKNISDEAIKKMGTTLEVTPGKTIAITQAGSIQQLNINIANLAILENVISGADSAIREVTGANGIVTGADPEQMGVTAFEINARQQGGSSRFQSLMTIFNNTTLEPLLKITFENDKQFKSKPEFIEGFEEELTPDLIKQMEMKWVITSSQATLNRAQNLANQKAFITEMLPQLVQSGVVRLKQEIAEVDAIQLLKNLFVTAGMPDAEGILKVVGSATEAVQSASGDINTMANQTGDPNATQLPGAVPASDGNGEVPITAPPVNPGELPPAGA